MFSAAGKKSVLYLFLFYSISRRRLQWDRSQRGGLRIIFVSPITHVTAFRLPHDPSSHVQSVFRFFLVFFILGLMRGPPVILRGRCCSTRFSTVRHRLRKSFGTQHSAFTLYEYGVHNMMPGTWIVHSRYYCGQVPVTKCCNISCIRTR